ncbi:GNAT family N-acetyltransferase [Paraburkholderia tropica]|uniref:Ribosomal protein S18 acetylase RimI n=1 Tax=Paraburkholderia tropica TaxID=92647 RepID=A0AAQ1GPD6_9BURK|nr:GNAT family N-acetyltransferase [Paraburkholderia tropica]RQN34190.1 N-acetyltransferase [Paraburkholderia tropica]SEK15223.1 Ribosomal protein S18 acetylase RimI [Paraburkholderia tropica]
MNIKATESSMQKASTTTPNYRLMTSADIPTAHAMSLAVSWPHRPEDWQFALDAGTGFVAELDGDVIGTALCWKHGPERASLGLVIVSDAYQGRGIGRTLMEMLLKEVGERVTFLHATPAGQPLYEKLGFSVCGLLNQHQGRVTETVPVVLPDNLRLRDAQPGDVSVLSALAASATGLERAAMLAALFQVGTGVVLERDGAIIGFSVFRSFGRGYVIGPVIATNSEDDLHAKALIGYWLAGRENEYIRVDVPDGSSVDDWLAEQGLPCVDSVVKMVRNAPADAHRRAPHPDLRWYGLITQAMF